MYFNSLGENEALFVLPFEKDYSQYSTMCLQPVCLDSIEVNKIVIYSTFLEL